MKLALKLTAVLVVMAAIALPRGTAHDRVLLLVLEGARSDVVRALARAGELPALEKIIAGGVGGDITGAAGVPSSDQLLERILSLPSVVDTGRVDPRRFLWKPLTHQSRPFVVSGVPEVPLDETGNAIVLPGPNASDGFVGMNTGLVVNRRTVERNAVAWPYSVVSGPLREGAAAASTAGEVQWVRWQDPSGADTRIGAFAVYALDDDTLYLSPVYTRVVDGDAVPGIPPGVLYVGDDPTRVIVSSRVAEYVPRHAGDLADARALAAVSIAESHHWDLLVHVDRRIAITELGTGPDHRREDAAAEERSVILADAYRAVDAMVARWLDIAGSRTAYLVVGLASEPRAQGEPIGWFAVASVAGDLGSWGPVTIDDLSATLSYLLAFDAGAGHPPLPAIAARFPLRSRFNVRSFVEDRDVVTVNADARTLVDLLKDVPSQ